MACDRLGPCIDIKMTPVLPTIPNKPNNNLLMISLMEFELAGAGFGRICQRFVEDRDVQKKTRITGYQAVIVPTLSNGSKI